MEVVFADVIRRIKPSAAEVCESKKMFSKIAEFIKSKYGLEARLMGSVAKDTFLSGDKDLDIFVFFPEKYPREKLERMGLEIGQAVFSEFASGEYTVSYAEHPYTKGVIEGFDVEIVPAYAVKEAGKIKSAVDRTPFHTNYVLSHLKKNEDVRLFKRFLKGIGCYGSDLKTEGFSGYLCEILVMHYGSFENVIAGAQDWQYQHIVDIESHYTVQDKKKVKKMFHEQPFIVIDPVDKKRNVAAVLSADKLARFILHSRMFLKKPTRRYFFGRERKIDREKSIVESEADGIKTYAIYFPRPDIIEDILYPQMRKMLANFIGFLEKRDFSVFDSWIFADKECGVAFKVINDTVPRHKIVFGPSVFNEVRHQDRFLETHEKVWLERDRLVSEVERACVKVDDCAKMFFTGSIDELCGRGVPEHIAKSVASKKRFVKGKKMLEIRSDEFWEGFVKENVKE